MKKNNERIIELNCNRNLQQKENPPWSIILLSNAKKDERDKLKKADFDLKIINFGNILKANKFGYSFF